MKNVVFIEPDSVMRRIYKKSLSSKKYKVYIFSSAEEAIKSMDTIIPDLIVMEIQLPGHNGVELIHELRSYTDLCEVPIIINSLVPQEAFMVTNKSMKANRTIAYFYKPQTNLEKLSNSIEEVLTNSET